MINCKALKNVYNVSLFVSDYFFTEEPSTTPIATSITTNKTMTTEEITTRLIVTSKTETHTTKPSNISIETTPLPPTEEVKIIVEESSFREADMRPSAILFGSLAMCIIIGEVSCIVLLDLTTICLHIDIMRGNICGRRKKKRRTQQRTILLTNRHVHRGAKQDVLLPKATVDNQENEKKHKTNHIKESIL